MIKEICDTCRDCRAWERPGNSTLPSVSFPGNWLDEGEVDLMFYKKRTILLWTDVSAWQQAKRSLIENVTLYWTPTTTAGLPIMDPSKTLHSDGEG
eukprot:6768797-Pyramimonas_sp.AAC.1